MAYKGMDLNLRSGNAIPAREPLGVEDGGSNGSWTHTGRNPAEPIQVDDNVLACCNSAYEAAQFHGASEVRLDHLLHAMTRVKAGADLLDQQGIRVGHLRHETAVAIASEAPAASPGKSTPRSSTELEDVLRRAAAMAAERRAPASLADLLRVLLGLGTKAPATVLLMRSAIDTLALERWRDEPTRREPAYTTGETDTKSARPNLADALFKRLDGMEAALRSLQTEVAAERRAITEAVAQRADGVVRSLQAEMSAERKAITEALAQHAEVIPGTNATQMQALVSGLEDKLLEVKSSLAERAAQPDKPPSGETWAYLNARLEVIEKALARQSKEVADSVGSVLLEHIVQLEDDKGTPIGPGIDRLKALEAGIETHLQRADEAAKTHEHSLAEIYEALVKLGTNQQTLASNLNTWRVESSGDVSIISNRLEQMERNAQETLSRLDGQVRALRAGSGGGWMMGFKRWLYGTTSVLSGAWRDNPDVVRKRLRPATTPTAEVKAAPKKEEESVIEIKVEPKPVPAATAEKKA